MAKIGDIALCAHKKLGLITHQHSNVYKGIKLEKDCLGHEWESKNPTVVGNISELLVIAMMPDSKAMKLSPINEPQTIKGLENTRRWEEDFCSLIQDNVEQAQDMAATEEPLTDEQKFAVAVYLGVPFHLKSDGSGWFTDPCYIVSGKDEILVLHRNSIHRMSIGHVVSI